MRQKPIAEKLQIKETPKVLLVNEPKDYRLILGKFSSSIEVTAEALEKPFDFTQVFVFSKKFLEDNYHS